METLLAPSLTFTTYSKIRRSRDLLIDGVITVKQGDKVCSDDIVGYVELPGEMHILRVSEKLAITPLEAISLIEKRGIKQGQYISIGEILAEIKGFFGLFYSNVTADVSGIVEFISTKTGHIGIREESNKVNLPAYLSGDIVEVHDKKGVVVETHGAFIQGIFGVGGARWGDLYVIKDIEGENISVKDLPSNCCEKVIVCSNVPSAEVLEAASRRGAVGFISGSVFDTDLKKFLGYDIGVALTGDEDISMSFIITEGFGDLPMSEEIFSFLKQFDGCKVSINGATQVRAGAVRPEIIISHDKKELQNRPDEALGLKIGSKVRLIRVPYFGLDGIVRELPNEPRKLETGTVTRVAIVEIIGSDNPLKVVVPRANLEVR